MWTLNDELEVTQQPQDVNILKVGNIISIEDKNRVDISIWRQFDIELTLDFGYTTKNNKCQHQLMSVLGIKLTLTLDVEFTLNVGHPTLQPRFNQISASAYVVCLLCNLKLNVYS